MVEPVAYLAMMVTAFLAAAADVKTGLVFNRITLPSMTLAMLWWWAVPWIADPAAGGLLPTWSDAALGLLAGLVPFVLLVVMTGGLGMGDAKLMGAVGAWLASPLAVLDVTVIAFLTAAGACLVWVIVTGRWRQTAVNVMLLLMGGLNRPRGEAQLSDADASPSTQRADPPEGAGCRAEPTPHVRRPDEVPFALFIAIGAAVAGARALLDWTPPWVG